MSRAELIKAAMELLPDHVILEMALPPLDGFEAAEALKLIMPALPVFLMTERYCLRIEKHALSIGVDGVFEKTHDLKALVLNARRCLRSRLGPVQRFFCLRAALPSQLPPDALMQSGFHNRDLRQRPRQRKI